jgi:peptidoglycan/LPS O-acetylase OafA/YrhL
VVSSASELRHPATGAACADNDRFAALDGFRFVAICTLVFYHTRGLFGFNPNQAIELSGFMVTYFFMVSGFVLAHQYPRIDNPPQYFRYLGARFARIVPACVVALIVVCVLSPAPVFDHDKLIPSFLANLFLLQSWIPDRNYFHCFNGPAWTLSIDAFLYLLLPAALLFAKRKWLFLTSSVAISFFAALVAFAWFRDDVHWAREVFPIARICDFSAGIVAYTLIRQRRHLGVGYSLLLDSGVIILSVILIAFFANVLSAPPTAAPKTNAFGFGVSFLMARLVPSFVFFSLLYTTSNSSGILSRILSWKPLVSLGALSCSLYLIHFPIIVYYRNVVGSFHTCTSPILYVTLWALILAAAAVLFLAVEEPARKWINWKLDAFFDQRFPGQTTPRWRSESKYGAQIKFFSGARLTQLSCCFVLTVVLATFLDQSILTAKNPPGLSSDQLATAKSRALEFPRDVDFQECLLLNSIKLETLDDNQGIILQTIWQTTNKSDRCGIAIHILDSAKNVIKQYDHPLLYCRPAEQIVWRDTVKIEKSVLASAKFLGVALVVDGKTLRANKGNTDWGSHRLLIELPPRIVQTNQLREDGTEL